MTEYGQVEAVLYSYGQATIIVRRDMRQVLRQGTQ